MNFRRAFILVIMDVLLLTELTFAIWWSHIDPEAVTSRFLQVFVPSATVTVVGIWWALKRWAPKRAALPGTPDHQSWQPVQLFGSQEFPE